MRVERLADRADAAIHHVGRRDDVDAGLRLVHRLGHQHRDAVVVVDIFAGAGVADHAVMAVVGVGVERHVADQAELGEFPLQQARRAAHQVLGVQRLGALGILDVGRRHREQRDGRDAERGGLLDMPGQPVERDPHHAGHRADLGGLAAALDG